MTRSDLIRILSEEYDEVLDPEDLETVVGIVVDSIADSLVDNRGAEIRGFGSFRNRKLAARTGRNPKSGKEVELGERLIPMFKAGQDLRNQLVISGS